MSDLKKIKYDFLLKLEKKLSISEINEIKTDLFGKNGLIAIIEDKSVESALCIIGATCADLDVMILDERYAKKALSEIIGKYEINGVIGKKCTVNKVLGSVEDLIFGLGYEKFLRNSISTINKKPLVLLNTSGSSNKPKFVALTHENLERNCRF